jgi:hypothetical protein
MAKKGNAIYAPGELSRVREKLGNIDEFEAKRMAQVLGGEVGTERNEDKDASKGGKSKGRDAIGGKRSSGRRIDTAGDEEERESIRSKPKIEFYPGDDPSEPVRLSYRERVKMDQLSGQLVFEIKNSIQILTSVFSFFKEPVDYVNSRFVVKRMNEYYHKIEKLVNSSRNLFPKNNTRRNNQLKRASPFAFKVMEVMRNWNIEQIAGSMAGLQARPRAVRATDFADILRDIYKPLYILSDLNLEHIKSVFKLIYKILYIESPMDAKEKYQDVIRNIIAALAEIRRDVQFGMYPLLMKLLSDRFIPYDRFFIERRRRFMAFLNTTSADQLNSADLNPQQMDSVDVEALQQDGDDEMLDGEVSEVVFKEEEEDSDDPKVIERKAKEEAERADIKALEHGLTALEALFPKAGWEKLEEYPDLYPYFASLYTLRGGFELIAPRDSLQQISVLMHILDDLFIGLRYVSFGTIIGPDGSHAKIGEEMADIVNNWRRAIEDSFSKDYLPRISEYCRMLENSTGEVRSSIYARKIMNELHWIKRLFFFPYYKFESIGPPPFPKQDVNPIYSQIRKLRKYLTAIAMGIEQGIRAGGAAAKAPCDGINNPWENYNFQIPNPVSKRLDMLLPPERRVNSTLIFFSLSAVTVLDYIVNSENSWTYASRPGPLFRSIREEGITPIFGVDEKIDADKIFKESMKKD